MATDAEAVTNALGNMTLAAAIAGMVGAAHTAKAVEATIGADATNAIHQHMLDAIRRFDKVPDELKQPLLKEINDVFSGS